MLSVRPEFVEILCGVMEAPDSPSSSHEFKIAAPSLAFEPSQKRWKKEPFYPNASPHPRLVSSAYPLGRGCMETCTSGELQMDLGWRACSGPEYCERLASSVGE